MDILYAGGAKPQSGGDVDLSSVAKIDLSNINATGENKVKSLAVSAVPTDDLAKADLSNLAEGLFYGSETSTRTVKFSNGLLLQWGAESLPDGTQTKLITLYVPYTTYFRSFAISNSGTAASTSIFATANDGLTGFNVHKSGPNGSFSWFTIGI